jgi:hypothetical protein
MNVGDERSKSIWVDTDVAPDATPLEKDMQVDTVVVGSGSPGSRHFEVCGRSESVCPRGLIFNEQAHIASW